MMAKLGSSNTANNNDKSSKYLSNHKNGNNGNNSSDNDSGKRKGIGGEDDDGLIITLIRDDEKGGSNGSSIERGELVEGEEMEEEEVDDDDNNDDGNDDDNDTAHKEDDEDESEMFLPPLNKNKSSSTEGKNSSTTKNDNDDDGDDDDDIGGITPNSSLPSSSSSSCCRRLLLLLLLIVVFPIGLLFVTHLMDRIVLAFNGAFTTTSNDGGGHTTGSSNVDHIIIEKPTSLVGGSISNKQLPIPYYDEEEAKKYLFYSKAAFCTEHAITTWTCGYMCDTVPISITKEGKYDPEHQKHKPKNMIRYIPEGRKYGVQGYVAQIPSSNSTTHNDLSNAGAKKCIVSFRGSLNSKNWYADFLIMLKPWPTDSMIKNLTITMNTNNDINGDKNVVDWCKGCKAHHGFASAYDELRYDVHRAIEELHCTSLVVSGHSLGAAIATLASFDLRTLSGIDAAGGTMEIIGRYHVESTWTYGLPRIGNAEFANSFVAAAISQNVSPPLWRIIHYHDPVPRLPPSIGKGGLHPVVHPPLEIYYTNRESSEYIVCPQQEGAIENTSSLCMAGWPSYLSLNTDHISYLNESFAFKDFPDECKATS